LDHRHLLPDEIDLLLDNEEGFGVQPLRAHVRGCAECRAELEEARAIVAELEHLPHLAPSPLFADRVMANVQVFEPWHVAALDSARRWVPQSRGARVLAGAFVASMAFMLTVASVWLIGHVNTVVFFSDLAVERTRTRLFDALTEALAGALGQPAFDAVRANGAMGVAVALMGLIVAVAIAAAGLRVMAGTSRRRRG
jgi:hypothetical protein